MRAPESMEVDTPSNDWTAEKLNLLKTDFLQNRSGSKAIALLEMLLQEKIDNISNNLWPDVVDLLTVLFDTIPIQDFLEKHQITLLSVINSSPPEVVDLIASHYIEPNMQKIQEVLKTSALAVTVALARRVKEEACYESLAKILWRFTEIREVLQEFEEQLKSRDSQMRFRVHHVTSYTLKHNPSAGEGLILLVKAVIKETESRDILSALSALEILCDATSDHIQNAQLFTNIGLVGKLYELMQTCKEEPEGGFLYPTIVRFFAHLSVVDPEALKKYPKFTESVFDMVGNFDRLDAPQRALAFETLAVISASSDAKKILSECTDMSKAMNHFGAACVSGPPELRTRHLEALNMLMSKSETPADSEILSRWFFQLGEPFPMLVLEYLKKPFEELRMATLTLLWSLMGYEWARKVFFHQEGFSDYLVSRDLETSAAGTQLKYDIVSKIVDSNSTSVDPQEMARLSLYKRQGVYYRETDPGIATEEA